MLKYPGVHEVRWQWKVSAASLFGILSSNGGPACPRGQRPAGSLVLRWKTHG